MTRVIIAPAGVLSLVALNRLFSNAVHTHFSYFPLETRKQVVKNHSLYRLLLATVDPRRVILIARSSRKIIGYAIGAAPNTGPAQLFWLYVDPEFRGANTGLSLLSRMLKLLSERGAQEVSIATHDHRAYYERQGFKFIEHRVIDGVQMDVLTFKLRGTPPT